LDLHASSAGDGEGGGAEEALGEKEGEKKDQNEGEEEKKGHVFGHSDKRLTVASGSRLDDIRESDAGEEGEEEVAAEADAPVLTEVRIIEEEEYTDFDLPPLVDCVGRGLSLCVALSIASNPPGACDVGSVLTDCF
jgi:hypothetical protein